MTVLSVVQGASLSLGLEYPSVLFSATTRTAMELQETANECALQILQAYDWSILKRIATFTGDGIASAFALPADYDRMVKDANIWGPSMTFYPSQQVSDFNQWVQLLSDNVETWQPRWAVFGSSVGSAPNRVDLNMLPPPALAEVYSFGYISNGIAYTFGDVGPDATLLRRFTSDDQVFRLSERLLKQSIIWNWKKAKGQDYAADLAEYEETMSDLTFKDTGARQTIISGRGRYRYPTGQAFP